MAEWRKFRKKPVEIEAVDWRGEFIPDVVVPFPAEANAVRCPSCTAAPHQHGIVKTLEGSHIACPSDVIIRGIKGEFYPCKRDIFDASYEELLTWSEARARMKPEEVFKPGAALG